uniref:Phosphatase tensin-type domain-containing protein n=1 Tax=Angiostrongylus cantonensis TaxID=6313 RepID=A0A158PAQ6_ANGCA
LGVRNGYRFPTYRLVLALCSPEDGSEKAYVDSLKYAALALKTKHFEHYKVWNVSRPRHDLTRCLAPENSGWPARLAPPLDRLCAICKQFEQWLLANNQNVIVIHCKVGLQIHREWRYEFWLYFSEEYVEERFDMKRFTDKYMGTNGQPSHMRYIMYFSSLLSGRIRVNPAPVYLYRITVSRLAGRVLSFKIYERLQPVYHTLPTWVHTSTWTFLIFAKLWTAGVYGGERTRYCPFRGVTRSPPHHAGPSFRLSLS